MTILGALWGGAKNLTKILLYSLPLHLVGNWFGKNVWPNNQNVALYLTFIKTDGIRVIFRLEETNTFHYQSNINPNDVRNNPIKTPKWIKTIILSSVKPLNASVALILKPVNWFAMQINWLVSIWR